MNACGQHLLYLLHTSRQLLRDNVGIGSLQHQGDSTDTFAITIHRHRTETFRSTEANLRNVADINRNAVVRGYDDLADIVDIGNHSLGTDVIGMLTFFDVASACILIATTECLENITDG